MIDRDTKSFKVGTKTKLVLIMVLGAILILSLGYLMNRSVNMFTSTFSPSI